MSDTNGKEPHIDITALWKAQLIYTASACLDFAQQGGTGDDGHDALIGALGLADELEEIRFDDDQSRLNALIAEGFKNWSVDGFCSELYTLVNNAQED